MRVSCISGVNFNAHYRVFKNDKNGTTVEQMDKDKEFSQLARKSIVGVPYYLIGKDSYKYTTKGFTADFNKHPIDEKHLYRALYYIGNMDEANIFHQDLELSHCHYHYDGSVQFDCFKFARKFEDGDNNLPPFEIPSNLPNYEKNSLSFYIQQMPNKEDRLDFAKKYLKTTSPYHLGKINILRQNMGEEVNGTVYTPDMLETEQVRYKACLNPDDTMAELFLKKMDFMNKERRAFTLWDEGGGAGGKNPNPIKQVVAVPLFLEAAKSAYKYSTVAHNLSLENPDKKEYYEIESAVGRFYGDMYINWADGMAEWRLGPFIAGDKTQKLWEDYADVINAPLSQKRKVINEYIRKYDEVTGCESLLTDLGYN